MVAKKKSGVIRRAVAQFSDSFCLHCRLLNIDICNLLHMCNRQWHRAWRSDSTWLHHTALRYMRRVQLGAYTWRKGLNSVKTGSKWAQNTCLSIPNGLRSLLEMRVFDPFLTHFWSQNDPFSRHFLFFHGPKHVTTGSKWAKNTCPSIPNCPGWHLEKRGFDPFWTHFWS